MLKAIWPSIARLPNHLPANANITTSGMFPYLRSVAAFLTSECRRHDVLLPLLAHPISVHVCFAAENPLAFPHQSNHCSSDLGTSDTTRLSSILLTRSFSSFKLAMLIWAFVKVPSSSPGGLIAEHTTLSGSSLSWAWLSALNSALGIYATLGVNIPDFTVGDSSYCCAIEILTAMFSDMQRTSERRSSCPASCSKYRTVFT